MARIEAGKLHLEKRARGAAEIIDGALGAGPGAQRPAGRLACARRTSRGRGPTSEFVEQVVKQFVENALKYSPEGSPLSISAALKGAKS